MPARVLVIGEILWDLFPDSRRLGGAPFNFAIHLHRLGHAVTFVSAVGTDPLGGEAIAAAQREGLSTGWIRRVDHETGRVTVRLDPHGKPTFHIHRPAAYDRLSLTPAEVAALAAIGPAWIYFGTLHQADPAAHALTLRLLDAIPGARRFLDINLRRDCYTAPLVQDLLARADVVKLSADEVPEVCRLIGEPVVEPAAFVRLTLERYDVRAVCVTLGAEGCLLARGEESVFAPGYAVAVADTVGAGDAFAAALLDGLDADQPLAAIADFANRLGALVASRPGAIPPWSRAEVAELHHHG